LISHEFLLLNVFVPDVAVVATGWIACTNSAYAKPIAAGGYGQHPSYAGYTGAIGADCTDADYTTRNQYAGSIGSYYAGQAAGCRVGSYNTISDQYAGSIGLYYASYAAGCGNCADHTGWIGNYGRTIGYDCA
jgi:hypothetical protein